MHALGWTWMAAHLMCLLPCLQTIPAQFLFSACPTNDMTLGVPIQSAAPSVGSSAPAVAGETAAAPAGGDTPPDSSFSGMSAHDLLMSCQRMIC